MNQKKTKKPTLYLGNIMGPEGNAYVILGRAQSVAREKKMTNWEEINKDAMSGDYSHLLQVIEKHFNVKYDL